MYAELSCGQSFSRSDARYLRTAAWELSRWFQTLAWIISRLNTLSGLSMKNFNSSNSSGERSIASPPLKSSWEASFNVRSPRDCFFRSLPRGPAHKRAHLGGQLVHQERFFEIVVRAGIEPLLDLLRRGPAGEHENQALAAAAAILLAKVHPAYGLFQIPVQDDQVISGHLQVVRALCGSVSHVDHVLLKSQPPADAFRHVHVVVDNDDLSHAVLSPRRLWQPPCRPVPSLLIPDPAGGQPGSFTKISQLCHGIRQPFC